MPGALTFPLGGWSAGSRGVGSAGYIMSYSRPPPPCPHTGQVLVQGAKVRKQGVAVFVQAHLTASQVPRHMLQA